MQYRHIGGSDLMVSEVGLGTWRHVSTADQPAADLLVRTALDLGITLFDTAGSYGDAEEALGRALRGVPKHSFVISTKVFYRRDGLVGGLSAAQIRSGAEDSMRRLGVGHIDLLSAHRFDPYVPLPETIAAFGELVTTGKVRYYGFSEWTAEQIAAACAVARELSVPGPIANQPQYSVLWRVPEARVLPTCAELGLGTVAFWSLAQGLLSGKYRTGVAPSPATRAGTEFGQATMCHLMEDPLLDRVQLFGRLAGRQAMTAAQLAVAWVLNRPGVSAALVGVSAPGQLGDSAAASGVRLGEEVMKLIDKIFAGCVRDDAEATG
jgi:aryl-alcohol dehydrogenase-like predicted oxidoreductase